MRATAPGELLVVVSGVLDLAWQELLAATICLQLHRAETLVVDARPLTFVDPDRKLVAGFGLHVLPALVHVRQDLTVAGVAEGWEPPSWRQVTDALSKAMSWTRPVIPAPTDPRPYAGTPAAG